MQERFRMEEVAPVAYRKVIDLHVYASENVDAGLLALVELRASMVNGCAFCVDMHSTDAAKAGEDPRRLFALSVWRESSFFTREERAALALTDAVTNIGTNGVPDDVWDEARQVFSEKETADLIMAVITMNAFNRIAISSRKTAAPAS
jgi:AhpD family alkylhydroperoxidase